MKILTICFTESKTCYIKADVALDLGCGNGLYTFPLTQYYKTIYGVDQSSYMIVDAILHNTSNKIKFKQGNFSEIPLSVGAVDIVFMSMHDIL